MTSVSARVLNRICADFTPPEVAWEIAQLLEATELSERLQAAIVLRAEGDRGEVARLIGFAAHDSRQVLWGSGLDDDDWEARMTVLLSSPEVRRAATHHAGHAVALLAFGHAFEALSAVATGHVLGVISDAVPEIGPCERFIIDAAGTAAELYADMLDLGEEVDLQLVRVALGLEQKAGHAELLQASEASLASVTGLIDARWDQIDALAHALITSLTGVLTFEECQQITTRVDLNRGGGESP